MRSGNETNNAVATRAGENPYEFKSMRPKSPPPSRPPIKSSSDSHSPGKSSVKPTQDNRSDKHVRTGNTLNLETVAEKFGKMKVSDP